MLMSNMLRCHAQAKTFLWLLTTIVLLAAGSFVSAQPRSEYRGIWVETFNTPLNSHADIVTVVERARAAKANALFAQVRRRGDSWYLNSLEPAPDNVPIQPGFDPLADLITEAHAYNIEVHAFVIIGAVWNRDPGLFPPASPNHVFNQHGGYSGGTITPGPNNWLTRTLLPDGGSITYQGHRFGAEFWIDLGHPAAADYTTNVLMHLVRNYNIDGLHLDRIRYPEISVSGQTPSTGANIGYNTTSVERFQRRYGITPGTAPPAPSDAQWSQWRRDQVTNFVRRMYLEAVATKPQLKVSAALIAFSNAPTTEASWTNAEAYWRVYQDWRAWTEEGTLDLAIPMIYRTEHTTAGAAGFTGWIEWMKNHQYNRAALIGIGNYLNAIEGTLRQTRRSLAPSTTGNTAKGVVFYSMATSNAAVTSNPYSIPAGQNTPVRSFAEFASGLTTGRSVDGTTLYEDTTANPTAIFAENATIPVLPWKTTPTLGHVKGFVTRRDLTPFDTATVTVFNRNTGAVVRTTTTDGNGFWGAVDLPPGSYYARAVLGDETMSSCLFYVTAGKVARANLRPGYRNWRRGCL